MNKENKPPGKEKITKETRLLLQENNQLSWSLKKNGSLLLTGSYKSAKITPHPNGLVLEIKREKGWRKLIYPGEIGFRQLTSVLCGELGVYQNKQKPSKDKIFISGEDYFNNAYREQKLQVSQALLQSGVWKNRGFSDKKKEAPKEFWKKLTISDMSQFDAYLGPRHFWKNMIKKSRHGFAQKDHIINNNNFINDDYRSDIIGENFHSLVMNESVDLAFKKNLLPDVPWAIRRWDNFSLSNLAEHAISGNYRSKKWAYYATNCTMFEKTFKAHNILNCITKENSPYDKMRDSIYEFLEKWPKTKNGVASLESAFNQGMNISYILALKPKSPNELKEYTTVFRQIVDKDRNHLNSTYEVPKIELKPGYKYVDHTDAHLMSDKYDCCFSNSQMYIDAIVRGEAFAVCRPKFGKGDLGILTFFEKKLNYKTGKREWMISENKGHGNTEPDNKYTLDMTALARAMTITHPESFLEVSQDPKLLFNNLNGLGKKYNEVQDLINSGIQEFHDNLYECSHISDIEGLHKINGYSFDFERMSWKETDNVDKQIFEYRYEFGHKNWKKIEAIIAVDRKNINIEISPIENKTQNNILAQIAENRNRDYMLVVRN